MKHNQTRWYSALSLIQNKSTIEFGYVEERTYNGLGTEVERTYFFASFVHIQIP